MWSLLCAVLFIELSFAAAFPVLQDILIPVENATSQIQSKCSAVQCPKLRCSKKILKEGDCCMSCDTKGLQVRGEILLSDSCTNNYQHVLGCSVDGKSYQELAMVPSNSSDPCEVCHCCIGEVVCSRIFQSCPQLNCNPNKIMLEEGKCCPRCAEENNIISNQATCKENGVTYKDGDVWNPYFPKFGTLKCQKCTCKNGKTNCEKLPCPPVRQCTDDDPVEETTICCPKCNRTVSETAESKDDGNGTYTPPTLEPTMLTSKPCSTIVHSFKVYETIDKHIDQIAIESMIIANVDVYVWSKDIAKAQYESYSSKTFANRYANTRFRYIGNTSKELIQTVSDWFNTRKRKHSLFYCKHICSSRVIKLLQPSYSEESNNNC